jgi:pimeloyl-ACP methyl ester carboxylesterase
LGTVTAAEYQCPPFELEKFEMRLANLFAVLAHVTILISATALAEDSARRPKPIVPKLLWTDCGGRFQCTTAQVPLDYDHPFARSIEVALIRRPATDPTSRIGSLFLNPGGPGLSGVDFVRTAPPPAFQLFAQFDIIGFDARGVGASRPAVVDCGVSPSYAIPYPRTSTISNRAFLDQARAYGETCRKMNREILPHLSTADVARDLDLLRAAVGDERLNYIGLSYGTVIGATYATMFPGRTRAMVLDSPIDVQLYYDDPVKQWREHAASHEHVLQRFLAACAASQGKCSFGGADPTAALDLLLARLDQDPIHSSDPSDSRALSGDHVRAVLEEILRTRRLWPVLAEALSKADAGDARMMLELFDSIPGNSSTDDFQTAVLAVDQRDGRRPAHEYFDLIERSERRLPHFWFLSGHWDLVRAIWPVDDHDAFRGRIRNPATAAPILVIGMTHDPATPYVQAQRLTRDLGNARLLTFEADGHGAATTFDPCVIQAMVLYVTQGVVPAAGAVCVQQGEPFP